MFFPDEIIRTNKQTGQIVPLRNIVRGPIESTITHLESWAVSVYQTMALQKHLICMKQMTFGCSTGQTRWLILANEWCLVTQSRNVSRLQNRSLKDSKCTELLDVFSPADAMHVKYPLSPIQIYATKPEV